MGRNAGSLRTSASGYIINIPAGSLDLQRFSALYDEAATVEDDHQRVALLREALALWRDRPLADIASEPFAVRFASALEERRLEALELRMEADLRLGGALTRPGARGVGGRAPVPGGDSGTA